MLYVGSRKLWGVILDDGPLSKYLEIDKLCLRNKFKDHESDDMISFGWILDELLENYQNSFRFGLVMTELNVHLGMYACMYPFVVSLSIDEMVCCLTDSDSPLCSAGRQLQEKMTELWNHHRHVNMGRPLWKSELLSVFIYTSSGFVASDMHRSHYKDSNHCRWKCLQYFLLRAVMKLSFCDEELYCRIWDGDTVSLWHGLTVSVHYSFVYICV